jgi:hypothetical protein
MTRKHVVALAFCLLAAGCQSAASTLPALSPAPVASPSPSASPSAAPTALPAPTATPSPTQTATPTPLPTGVPGALAFVQAYEDALLTGNFDQAWSMIAPGSMAGATLDSYTAERTAFLQTSGKGYAVVANPPDSMPLAGWLNGQPFAAQIDQAHAVLVKVTWTALADNNAGWEMWVVNPVSGGAGWELYEVR